MNNNVLETPYLGIGISVAAWYISKKMGAKHPVLIGLGVAGIILAFNTYSDSQTSQSGSIGDLSGF